MDDNNNGAIDCRDQAACGSDPACVEDCTNGIDDDGDGLADCEEPSCAADIFGGCTSIEFLPPAEDCATPGDEDGDGASDCSDLADCVSGLLTGLAPGCEEICDNGIDDNATGLADCEDPQCAAAVACNP